jgi:hypothetical protein
MAAFAVDGNFPPGYMLLTMQRLTRYKPALVAVLLLSPAAALSTSVAGASLPDGAQSLGENRFKLTKNWEDALKFYKSVYPPAKYPRKSIVNQPGIKAVHIENPDPKPGSWDGLNVYEMQSEVRVFVLVAPGGEKKGKKK